MPSSTSQRPSSVELRILSFFFPRNFNVGRSTSALVFTSYLAQSFVIFYPITDYVAYKAYIHAPTGGISFVDFVISTREMHSLGELV
jgi:hypothetical protein